MDYGKFIYNQFHRSNQIYFLILCTELDHYLSEFINLHISNYKYLDFTVITLTFKANLIKYIRALM